MLTTCPECKLQISSKAAICPHCGYPINKNIKSQYKSTTKRKRLPNGFGQISEIKGQNLRNPYRVMVTVGKTEDGKPISKLLKPKAYFHTYNEAYTALIEYNKNPYELDKTITMSELYSEWSNKHFEKLSNSAKASIESAWKYCSSIYGLRVIEVRPKHIKDCMENGTINYGNSIRHTTPTIQAKIKSVFNMLFDYAVEYDLTDKNYSRLFNPNIQEDHKKHIDFTDEELSLLWKNLSIPTVDMLLIQCYSGWRPSELIQMKISDIDLDKGTMIGGMKTKAGTNRIVPIHSKIKPFLEKRYEDALSSNQLSLFTFPSKKTSYELSEFTYNKYSLEIDKIVKLLKLNPEHKPHDGRKTFVTLAKKYNVDEYAIKYIVGHTISDITENVYTTRSIEWLKSEIEKIK